MNRVDEPAAALLQTDKLSEQVYRLLRDRIVNGQLALGERLSLEGLVAELGVSRTPLREALSRLERERLVVTRPRSGTYVAVLEVSDIIEVCNLRRAIEWQAIQLATPAIPTEILLELQREILSAELLAEAGNYPPFFECDSRLHRTIFDYCDNQRLRDVQETIDSYVRWLRVLGATGVHRIQGSSLRHRRIVAAMLERDPQAAADAMATHIDEVRLWAIEDFQSGDKMKGSILGKRKGGSRQ